MCDIPRVCHGVPDFSDDRGRSKAPGSEAFATDVNNNVYCTETELRTVHSDILSRAVSHRLTMIFSGTGT